MDGIAELSLSSNRRTVLEGQRFHSIGFDPPPIVVFNDFTMSDPFQNSTSGFSPDEIAMLKYQKSPFWSIRK